MAAEVNTVKQGDYPSIKTVGIRVFVYGTLKQGHGNHDALRHSDFLGRCALTGNYALLSLGWFPGLIESKDQPQRTVVGEVYRISRETLDVLDMIEGHPNFYRRVKVSTPWKGAWAYFLPEDYAKKYPIVAAPVWKPNAIESAWVEENVNASAA